MTTGGNRKTVAIIGTGGTISFDGRHSLDSYEYVDHGTRHSIQDVVGRFKEIEEVADLEFVDFRSLSSSAISPEDWLALSKTVTQVGNADPTPAGIVITHGTATMEETAYFLNLTVKTETPVVLVGAQRPKNTLGSDAGPNLLNAVQAAVSPELRGLGVTVVFNEEIQAAREVTKTSTHRLETFRSPDLGMLGYTDPDGRVALYRRPSRPHTVQTEFDIADTDCLPRVDIAASYGGADGSAVEAFTAAGADAIVMSTVAPGLVTPAQQDAVEKAQQAGVVIVFSSRVGSGRVLPRTSMKNAGIVAADNLNPQKARVLTMLALTISKDPARLQQLFDTY